VLDDFALNSCEFSYLLDHSLDRDSDVLNATILNANLEAGFAIEATLRRIRNQFRERCLKLLDLVF